MGVGLSISHGWFRMVPEVDVDGFVLGWLVTQQCMRLFRMNAGEGKCEIGEERSRRAVAFR
jgi:hypothetical protein